MRMKFILDGGNIHIKDGAASMELDSDQAIEFIQTYLRDTCSICFYASQTPICCDCLQKEIEKHREELHGCA